MMFEVSSKINGLAIFDRNSYRKSLLSYIPILPIDPFLKRHLNAAEPLTQPEYTSQSLGSNHGVKFESICYNHMGIPQRR